MIWAYYFGDDGCRGIMHCEFADKLKSPGTLSDFRAAMPALWREHRKELRESNDTNLRSQESDGRTAG